MKWIKFLFVITFSTNLNAQIALNTSGNPPDASAAWDIQFTDKGILIPRVSLSSTSDGTTITNPATSLLVYNTNASITGGQGVGYYYNAGTPASPNWVKFLAGKEAWMITGNDNTTAPTSGYGTPINNNFIGTTNAVDFAIATNNIERMRIKTDDGNNLRIGMGTAFTVNLTGVGNPSILHLHDWGTTTNDYSQFNISTSSTNVGRVGVINFAATQVTNEKRLAAIESYLTNTAPNASGDLRFYTNNENTFRERMRLYETGQLVLSDNSTFPSPTANYLFTINPTTDTYRSGISIRMSGATSTAFAINVTSANANSRGYFYENTSVSNGVFYGAGAQLSSTNIVSGYLAYRNSSGFSYGIYGINGTNASYATNANTWAAFIQGRAVISSESSPTSPLGVDLEIRNTTTGSGNPATLSMRQTTQESTTGRILARLNFGDNYTTDPQAQISIIREAAGGSGDYPTAIIFSNTPDGSSTLTERMRISNNGNVGINTTSPSNKLGVLGSIGWGATSEVNALNTDQGGSIELGGTNSIANPVTNGAPYIDFHFGTGSAQDYNVRIINSANNRLDFTTATNGNQLSIHTTGIALSGTNKYINFGTTFDASGYGFRDNNGTLEYKHSGGTWTAFAQPPTVPGNVEWWIRPTGEFYIRPLYNANARVYDAGQTWAFYYDGSNTKGSFFAGGSVGAVIHRSGIASTNVPTFIPDQYPFVDAGNDAAITSADNVTYTGGYAYGSLFNGFTGIARLDAGLRGIGLGNTSGTNSSWPVVGVMGEVIATGSSSNGQQGVYGWQAAPAGNAEMCIGVLGRTSQTGNQSAGVAGYYTNTVGNLVTCFSSFQSIGLLGTGTTGVTGQTSVAGGYGVLAINTDLTSNSSVGVQGQVGNGTSQTVDFKAIVGISNNTNNIYGYGGYFKGEYYGVYGYNPTTSQGYAVYYSGNLAGSGTKSCVMRTSQGPKALYCVESPENWFEDMGEAVIKNGKCRVEIAKDFMEVITINDTIKYHVFITPHGNIGNWWIVKEKDAFTLYCENTNINDISFDYKITAKRKGYENLRMKDAPEAYTDPALYPDPNDPSIPYEWRKKVKDHFDFLERIKNPPIQKPELKNEKEINKIELEKMMREGSFPKD